MVSDWARSPATKGGPCISPSSSSDREDVQLGPAGGNRVCVLHRVAARGVDLLRGGGPGAVLLQLQDGTAAENADCKRRARVKPSSGGGGRSPAPALPAG